MKPKATTKFFLFTSTLILSTTPWVFAKTTPIDLKTSQLRWVGKKVTGQHDGIITLKSGQVDFDGKKLKGGKFTIDMTSIVVEDLKDAEYNAKLTKHLKSDDFFSVEKFPVSSFTITSVKPVTDNAAATHEVSGNLMIKGVNHPVTFPAKIEVKDGKAHAKAKITVDRTKYNIRYGSGKFFDNLGDKMIDDEFVIELNLQSKAF